MLNMPATHEDVAMSDFSQSHKRHHEYTYRLPTPPRIVVPPPTLSAEVPELSMGSASETPEDEMDTSFLKEQNLESIVQRNTLLEWSYERRRQAQMILPWIYLGPLVAAKDKSFLAREGVTMIIAVRQREGSLAGVLKSAQDTGLEIGTIEAANFYELIGQFSRATNMINRHVSKIHRRTGEPGKVLVFCESGNEKSAATVAAYMMEVLDNFDYIKSMQVCQAQRFCVNFDDTLKNILRSYWDILNAKRAVALSARSPACTSHNTMATPLQGQLLVPTKQKRTIDDTVNVDVNMDDDEDLSDDVLRFSGRDVTPFRDQ